MKNDIIDADTMNKAYMEFMINGGNGDNQSH